MIGCAPQIAFPAEQSDALLALFAASYCLNIVYMSVFYHRGFTHGAFTMGPRLRRFVAVTGSWVTGLDPKAWACMHRLHHLHSDNAGDPHSPHQVGVLGVFELSSFPTSAPCAAWR